MHDRDVLIHTAPLDQDNKDPKGTLPFQTRIELSDDLWIGRLEDHIAKSVLEACDKRHFGPIPNARAFCQSYSYVRELSPGDTHWNWDADHRLETTVAISRLIHPTSAGLLSAARVRFDASGHIEEIYPAVRSGMSSEVFLSPQRTRNWLTEPEAHILRELVPLFPLPLAQRVHAAFWHHEYAARTYYINYRWTLVCTGLEALIHTDRGRSTEQFVRRVPALASALGIPISETLADEAYDVRSRLAHGLSLLATGGSGPPESQVKLYDLLEDILRLAVLRCMRDPEFASIFQDEYAIRARWPL